MGNDNYSLAARLRLDPALTEAQLVLHARTDLIARADDLHKFVERAALASASTLEELFAPFDQFVMRHDGQVISMYGADGRYHGHEALLDAIAVGVRDGSWVAFETDYLGTTLVTFNGGRAQRHSLGGDRFRYQQLTVGLAEDAPALTGDHATDLTHALAYLSGCALELGVVPPTT